MNKNLYALLGCAAFITAAAGCTPAAREDVGQAGDNLSQAAQKSAEGTAVAADKAGDKIAAETTEAVQDGQRALNNAGQEIKEETTQAGQAIERGAAKAGEEIREETAQAGQAIERGVAKAGDATQDAAATVGLTAKVRNAIISDTTTNIPNLNVDTKADAKQVIVKGNAVSQAQHDKVLSLARQALKDSKSDFKIVDQLTVAGK